MCVSMDRGKKNPISALTTLCKQVSYYVSVMSTTLSISISILIVGGFRDVSSEDV